jgi:restriction endonuclease S subunit
MAVNQGFAALVAGPRVNPEWLMIWCQAHRDVFVGLAGGSTFLEVSKPKVRAVSVDLPSLPQQRRMVDLIGALDAARSSAESVARQLTVARISASEELISHSAYPRAQLRDLAVPKGLVGGPFGSSLVSKDYRLAGVPVIRGANLSTRSRFLAGPYVFVTEEKAQSLGHNQAVPGDVIATQRGTLGQVAIVPAGPYDKYVVSQSQMRLRVDPAKAVPEYVRAALSTSIALMDIESKKIATANPHINLGIFGALEIPIPVPATQSQIGDLMIAFEEAERGATAYLSALDVVRAALLIELLIGDHEIPESYDRFLDGAA